MGHNKTLQKIVLITTLTLLTFPKNVTCSTSSPHYVQFRCPKTDFSYTLGSAFEANLKHALLDLLPSNTGSSSFIHVATETDQIYALYYCRGDITVENCQSCVQSASVTVLHACRPLKEGIVWYEECTVYYSNRSTILSPQEHVEEEEEQHNPKYRMSNAVNKIDSNQYQEVFNSTMNELISRAAFGELQGFASAETELDLTQTEPEPVDQAQARSGLTLRGLVQCSPLNVGKTCEKCLRTAVKEMDGWATTMVFLPGCSLRLDLFPSQIKVADYYDPLSPATAPIDGDLPLFEIEDHGSSSRHLQAILPILAVCLLVLSIVGFLMRHYIRRIVFHYSPNGSQGFGGLREYTYWELAFATCFFFKGLKLGHGAFGPVYKGCLPDGRKVAIKRLNFEDSHQGDKEFQTEIATISRISHENVVSLYGYCIHHDERMLVYKYMPNKTLHHHLHEGGENLTWQRRVTIASRLAEAVAYLHDNTPAVIHRDIKPYNILMDCDFEPKIGDFGLAKLCPKFQTHMETLVRGTEGYIDPYYFATRELTRESDVFAFGVVLLELITGRPSSFHHHETRQRMHIRDWAVPLIMEAIQESHPIVRRRKFEEFIDPALRNDFLLYEADRMVTCAAICVLSDRTMRPSMSLVVQVLKDSDEQIIRELNVRLKNYWYHRNQSQKNIMNIVRGISSNIHHFEIKIDSSY